MASGYSMASALEEDRRDIMATLEREPREKEKKPRRRSCSRSRNRGDTAPPQSLASAMEEDRMEILASLENEDDEEDKPRHASIAGTNSRGISFIQPPIRSMLDITTPFPPPRSRGTNSAQASPTVETFRRSNSVTRTRSNSDATARPVEFGPRAPDKMSRYQFSSFLSNNPSGPSVSKRASQGSMNFPSAMASVVSGAGIDLSSFMGRGRGRNNSIAGTGIRTGQSKSRSPHSRFSLRSSSPSVNNRKIQLDSGRFIDSKEAIERLSDANLASSGGTLAELPKPKSRRDRTDNGSNNDSGRLEKDKSIADGEEAVESSDDENQSSDEEGPRGRRSRENSIDTLLPNEIAPGRPYTYSSLLDPEITVTSPGSDGRSRSGMADYNNSGINTPVDSDAEENMNDIKRAQKLSINLTEISSTPATKRCVRTLYRGDFPKMQQEALDDVRRVRKYLVATDLSPESQHALEWTIGTVLRDGDTLLAIYCVDEKKDIPQEEVTDSQMKVSEGSAVQGSKGSGSTPVLTAAAETGPLGSNIPRLGSPSTSASPAGRERSQMEQERFRLVQNITDRVTRLLRKTKLQVRVVIEVIHCKNAMHLITEVIDYISPTLVILGCRGRNALKSSLLGSFSNYVVTKSSVPVMVAKKKFKKHGKAKRPRVRLVNNLENPIKSLSDARID